METSLKYMPVFRTRQEEEKVFKTFDFEDRIFPCLEIVKEFDRDRDASKQKKFEEIYLPLIKKIKAKKVFIDLPVHLNVSSRTKKTTLSFFRKVVSKRIDRTDYMNKLSPVSNKVIPIISTYFKQTGEAGSIKVQEKDLRKNFPILAFRTFLNSYDNDLSQIEAIVKKDDFLIVDLGKTEIDLADEEFKELQDRLDYFTKCPVILLRSAINPDIRNVDLLHDETVSDIDNSLINVYTSLHCECFSDYVGIKKDDITDGGSISPGFIYYDAVKNNYYGYKGRIDELGTFETVIVPDVIASLSTKRMRTCGKDFLSSDNIGWKMINDIKLGTEKGKSMAKFKRISMEHYLHCIKTRIKLGEFN